MIELMVVVAIIGILAAIAIPQYSEFRTRSFNATAVTDLRNIMTAEEALYAGIQTYTNLAVTKGPQSNLTSLPGATLALNICARVTSATALGFNAQAEHLAGDITYTGDLSYDLTEASKALKVYTLGCVP